MRKRALYIFIFCLGLLSYGQTCPRMSDPINGSVGVPLDVVLRWNEASGIDGYLISLGTTPGGTDILNRRSAGLVNSFTPELGLPDDTRIYVTISLFITEGTLIDCPGETFTTEDVTEPPPCTQLVSGDTFGSIYWAYAYGATGYRVTIGTTSGGNDIADNVDVGNVLSYAPEKDLPLDQEIFVQIVPYNENGDNGPCQIESLIVSEPEFDCSPFLPQVDIPDQVGICIDGTTPTLLSRIVRASGFRWFRKNQDGTESLLSETNEFLPSDIGEYRFEAFNTVSQDGVPIECISSKDFTVIRSQAPTITSVEIKRQTSGLEITVNVTGEGDYEYTINSEFGPFQASPVFQNVPKGERTVFVRDKNGCGQVQRTIELDLSAENFPRFFTPNQDGANDFWQFRPSPESGEINLEYIRIYDRYGNLLKHLDPRSQGWDGSFKGRPLPESDYWYRAASFSGQEIQGHFTLKR